MALEFSSPEYVSNFRNDPDKLVVNLKKEFYEYSYPQSDLFAELAAENSKKLVSLEIPPQVEAQEAAAI